MTTDTDTPSIDEDEIGDNSKARLLSFIERVERVNEEIKALGEDRKEIFLEAAEAGYSVKAMRRVIKERAMDQDELDEFDRLVAQYWGVLGR